MAYFRTQDGCSLYYETVGFDLARPVVVFLNGTLQTTMYWKVIAASLKPLFRSLLYDARGQGESEVGPTPLSLNLHLTDLLALLRHLELEPVCLVGLSHGGLLAYAMARRYPKLVSRMVLCSIGVGASMRARLIVRSWLKIVQRGGLDTLADAVLPHVFGERYLLENRKNVQRIAKTIIRRNREASLVAHLSAMSDYPRLRSLLAPLEMPSLTMCGGDDVLVRIGGAAEVAQKSGGRHMVFEGVGHSIPVEAPEAFLDAVSRFLGDRWTAMPEDV